MHRSSPKSRLKPALLACVAGLSFLTSPAVAQAVDSNKLLELMVTKGLVSRADADALLAEAAVAPAQPAAATQAPTFVGGVSGDTQTIPYIPQTVRDQIKSELRNELANQASSEGWAKPGEVAEWTKRITLSGDVRVRAEGVSMDKGNYPDFVNFGSINAGSGYDVSPANLNNPPYLNSLEDRNRARIRARLGINAKIDERISAELRVASGSDNSPVSTNQTLGGGGNLGKYAIWLDRANIRLTPVKGVDLVFGRFANPFWTTELLFDNDLNFDGVALSGKGAVNEQLELFGSVGAFPVFNTDFNFGSRDAGAFSSKDKYMLAGQIGAAFSPTDKVKIKLAGGYYRFENVQGETSSPCAFNQDVCDTDPTRPQFQQFGNTLFPIRNIVANPAASPGASPEVQYFGLASKYEILNVHGSIDLGFFDPVGVRIEGDFVKNLGFDRNLIAGRAINNMGANSAGFDGGDTGWYANLLIGHSEIKARWDWNASIGYKHVESDAVLDAFTDSDFHLGGTNAKGFILGGALGLGKNTAVGLRWLSADAVSGAPYSNDIVQLDLTTKF